MNRALRGLARDATRRARMLLLALVILAALPATAPSQGCSMCRETAAFQKDRAINALRGGIITLAIPPAGIGIGLAWLTWKRSKRFSS